MKVKDKIFKIVIPLFTLLQCVIFIEFNLFNIEKEHIETKEVIATYSLTLKEVLNKLEGIEKFNIRNIKESNQGFEINGEIHGNKDEVEEILNKINYFGVISYTINIENNDIYLSISIKERANNNCI